MAGTYPDPPGYRMAYDADGTIVKWGGDSSLTSGALGQGSVNAFNDESSSQAVGTWSQYYNGSRVFCWLFPEQRDMTGIIINIENDFVRGGYSTSDGRVYTSQDTTDGINGTWTDRGTMYQFRTGFSHAAYRNGGPAGLHVDWPNCRAVRIHTNFANAYSDDTFTRGVLLFGTPTDASAPHRLKFWHPTLNEELPGESFDWGNQFRGNSSLVTKDFRIKNNSSTTTATNVTLTFTALTDNGTPTTVQSHTLSDTGGAAYASSVVIPSISPGALSPVIRMKYEPLITNNLGLRWLRLRAEAVALTTPTSHAYIYTYVTELAPNLALNRGYICGKAPGGIVDAIGMG